MMPLMALVMSAVTAITAPDAPRPPDARLQRALTAPNRHVRTFDRRIVDALFTGMRRSTTFGGLVAMLDASDVIAYIELKHDLPSGTNGRLTMLSNSRAQRYVRIQVRTLLPPDDMIATIAHELQHAVEIAAASSVYDATTMRKFYEVAGAGRSTAIGFETQQAQDAGRRVRKELRKNA
jgi:hypothetical protein